MTDNRIPVTVLTGFLGSGKTSLLQKLLRYEEGAGVAVLMNEIGEIALDNLLVQELTESMIVLKNGCVCCTIREDLQKGLRKLIDEKDKTAFFNRIVIETTGLADPTPIVQTLDGDIMLRRQARIANIIATVDALFGAETIDSYDESLKQVGLADRIVLTKTDIASPDKIAAIRKKIDKINPMAVTLDVNRTDALWRQLFDIDPFNPNTKNEEIRIWLNKLPHNDCHSHHKETPNSKEFGEDVFGYHDGVETFVIRTEIPLNWTAFAIWLSALVHRYGKNILRIKGLLNVPGAFGPVVLNTVQSHITPPMHLENWLDDDHSSRIVFIVRGIEPQIIEKSLHIFLSMLEK